MLDMNFRSYNNAVSVKGFFTPTAYFLPEFNREKTADFTNNV